MTNFTCGFQGKSLQEVICTLKFEEWEEAGYGVCVRACVCECSRWRKDMCKAPRWEEARQMWEAERRPVSDTSKSWNLRGRSMIVQDCIKQSNQSGFYSTGNHWRIFQQVCNTILHILKRLENSGTKEAKLGLSFSLQLDFNKEENRCCPLGPNPGHREGNQCMVIKWWM